MSHHVLVVDDDRVLIHLIKKKFSDLSDQFTTLTAANGEEAIALLKKNPVSLVVTDLQMPKMDGFALMADLSEHYPDIPVIVLTAYGSTETKQTAMSHGATQFIDKPFVVEELAKAIQAGLAKESDGGVLQTVSLEMFIQLVEMDQKTCTVRVVDKDSEEQGILFFKEGTLLDARLRDVHGKAAALEIFSWRQARLAIQDSCVLNKRKIAGSLQAILFDAVRLRDEQGLTENDFSETDAYDPECDFPDAPPLQDPDSLAEVIRQRIGSPEGISGIGPDSKWGAIIDSTAMLSEALCAGPFKSGFFNMGDGTGTIVLPATVPLAVKFTTACPQEIIRKILYD